MIKYYQIVDNKYKHIEDKKAYEVVDKTKTLVNLDNAELVKLGELLKTADAISRKSFQLYMVAYQWRYDKLTDEQFIHLLRAVMDGVFTTGGSNDEY
ncbi:hypothetical protein SY212_03380 [Ligilactobacillus agilis]|uniref:Uncharacterized protein n=1 Tax=Ligilactobacillus agilis TaxID=1601 RepID=A0A6F9XJE2_9LACO|nr:hypothetical protein [Ligilactobacillus agilis]GET05308.1 hypothetical protein SY212_03380 [Ligilactobacillus agilis]